MTEKPDEKDSSKRAKRKQPNSKNIWVAHAPKIQSPAARAKAYLRVAGLSSSTNNTKTPDVTLDANSPIQQFGRLLGGTNQRVRHNAVIQLRTYLKQRCDDDAPGLSQLDLLKLWKCLWFTLYMADQVPVQEELANHLSKLIWCVAGTEEEDECAAQVYLDLCEQEERDEFDEDDSDDDDENDSDDDEEEEADVFMEEVFNSLDGDDAEENGEDSESESSGSDSNDDPSEQRGENRAEDSDEDSDNESDTEVDLSSIPHRRGAHLAQLFLRCLLSTILREWGNMDKYRIDKFYMLLRMVLRQAYEYMAQRHWNRGIIQLFNDAIFEEVLNQTPSGMRLHFIDICVDELAAANATAPMPLTEATLSDVLMPYFSLAQTGADGDDVLHQRAIEKVLLKFLDKYSVVAETNDDEDVPIMDQVHVGTIAEFIFEIASDGGTSDRYRKALYEVHKKYIRRLKQVGRDVELHHQEADDDDDEDGFAEENDEQHSGTSSESKVDDKQQAGEETREPEPKRKKKKRKKSGKGLDAEMSEPVKQDVATSSPATKRVVNEVVSSPEPVEADSKKKKKKNKRDSGVDEQEIAPAHTSRARKESEDEVVISVMDQKAAKDALKGNKKAKDNRKKRGDEKASSQTDGDNKRRVKFNAFNQARSWKTSMKGLREQEPKAHKVSTPEKSILLNKGTPIPIVKGHRKKALDYFKM
jgi:hypothetical protein